MDDVNLAVSQYTNTQQPQTQNQPAPHETATYNNTQDIELWVSAWSDCV